MPDGIRPRLDAGLEQGAKPRIHTAKPGGGNRHENRFPSPGMKKAPGGALQSLLRGKCSPEILSASSHRQSDI